MLYKLNITIERRVLWRFEQNLVVYRVTAADTSEIAAKPMGIARFSNIIAEDYNGNHSVYMIAGFLI